MMSLLIRNLVFTVVVPGLWDAPRRVVAHGPYRWVRNPIYLAALLVVLGEAALFGSLLAAGLRGRAGGLLPPVRHWLRGAGAAPPLRTRLPGVPARGPALDPAPPVLSRASLRGRGHDRRREVAGLMGG